MKVEKTKLKGVLLIKPDIHEDYRGSFTEVYNEKVYREAGINDRFIQDDLSTSYKGVLKGMHGDSKTAKLVHCAYGRVYQVVLNNDRSSDEYGKWESFILTSDNRYQVYIPPMFGNGFYVLSEIAVYSYKQTTLYGDASQFTVKWDDPQFDIVWPDSNPILSARDR